MPEESGGEKTLPASPMKRQKAREKGNVPKSQDLSAAWTLLVALIAMRLIGFTIFEDMARTTQYYFSNAAEFTPSTQSLLFLGLSAIERLGTIMMPFLIIMLFASLAISVLQVGLLIAPAALQPNPGRLNPIAGFGRYFSIRSFVELCKSVAKLLIIGWVVYMTLKGRWEELMVLSNLTPIAIAKVLADLTLLVWFRVVLVMLVLGLLDYAFQRWQHDQDLRMTHQEAREETKQLEGDPRIKQRVRQIQRQMAMQRMMAEIPEADVVITNPTHYAVALRYDLNRMDAPVVVAKGARLLAQRIREVAVEHRVPIVEKPELARTLHKNVEVADPVPETLYRAVAEVLQFVYAVDRRVGKMREREQFLKTMRPAAS